MTAIDAPYRGMLGMPELSPQPGGSLTVHHSLMEIAAESGFASVRLGIPQGMVLALDWVVETTLHIGGSAVMVAPGVALTARHTVDAMRERGFLRPDGGQLLALGFEQDNSLTIWATKSFTTISDGDLSVLTLVRGYRRIDCENIGSPAGIVSPTAGAQRKDRHDWVRCNARNDRRLCA
jgi:hypothetical protein